MTMTPGLRKFMLAVHLTVSVGWIGAVMAYLALGISARTSQDAQTVRAAWIAMELTGWRVIVPLALATLVTGIVMSVGTPWGLFRHFWVLITLVLTIVCTVVLLRHLPEVSAVAAVVRKADATARAGRGGDLLHPGVGLLVLLVITALNVYKPRGLTPYGWRKQQEEHSRRHAQSTVPVPYMRHQRIARLRFPALLGDKSRESAFRGPEKGAHFMHSFAHHRHSESTEAPASTTQGRILNQGWRYDVKVGLLDAFVFRGKLRQLRQRVVDLARLQPGERVLDVGCGTGTLAIAAQEAVGPTGRVVGVDPGAQQIAWARSKAARRDMRVDFQIGVIEHLAFPDETFDVALSSLMMHHLPSDLRRRGLSELARVLKPEGRLVVADFKRSQNRPDQPAQPDADLSAFVREAGFAITETVEVPLPHRPGYRAGAKGFGLLIGGHIVPAAVKLIVLAAGAVLLGGAPRLEMVAFMAGLHVLHVAGLALVLGSLYALGGRAMLRRFTGPKGIQPRFAHGRPGPAILRHGEEALVEIVVAHATAECDADSERAPHCGEPPAMGHKVSLHKIVCPRCGSEFVSHDIEELVHIVRTHARTVHHHEVPRERVLRHIVSGNEPFRQACDSPR